MKSSEKEKSIPDQLIDVEKYKTVSNSSLPNKDRDTNSTDIAEKKNKNKKKKRKNNGNSNNRFKSRNTVEKK